MSEQSQIGVINKFDALKRAKEGADFNQIDKRWVDSYFEMWRFNEKIRKMRPDYSQPVVGFNSRKDEVFKKNFVSSAV